MKNNPVKAKLLAGKPVIGPIMGFNAPILAELFAYAGYDFVVFDAEHGPLTEESCENLVRTAEAANIPAIIRCPQNVPQVILRFADTGAVGLHIPQINTRQDAITAVRSTRYYPFGQRGLAGIRALDYGAAGPLSEKLKLVNQEIMVIAHIENIQAVENLSDLIAVDGVDVYFIGPSDLSHSMGIPAQYDDPRLRSTIDKVIQDLKTAGKNPGILARNGEEAKKYIEQGVKYVIVGAAGLIMAGARAFLKQAREG